MENIGAILLAEDNSDDVNLIQKSLQAAGYHNRIIVCSDGEKALKYLKGEDQYADRKSFPLPQLILLDLKMPRVSGFEILQWVRSDPQLGHLPVVVLTNSSLSPEVKKAYQMGANSFLTKPHDMNEFIAALKEFGNFWLKRCEMPPSMTKSGIPLDASKSTLSPQQLSEPGP